MTVPVVASIDEDERYADLGEIGETIASSLSHETTCPTEVAAYSFALGLAAGVFTAGWAREFLDRLGLRRDLATCLLAEAIASRWTMSADGPPMTSSPASPRPSPTL